MKKKPKEPQLFGMRHPFDNGWYSLMRYDADFHMRGMTHRIRGGFMADTVTFRSGNIITGTADLGPDLDGGIVVGWDYEKHVADGVARIHPKPIFMRTLTGLPRWSVLLYRPSPCPPWEHTPIKLCDCPTP